ncbi:hypothetical protein Bbelb_408240 [Branchiostoma belcheri]|nr:hypothetical protein Bbelb_408240 [Branchiostoma belcheri]
MSYRESVQDTTVYIPSTNSRPSPWQPRCGHDCATATTLDLQGQVSNGSCLQLADESSARRAGVVKAELERNQVTGSSLQAPEPEPARLPRWIRWGKTDAQVCGSQIRNLLSTLNKSTRRLPCQL